MEWPHAETGEASGRTDLGRKIRNSVQDMLSLAYFLDLQVKMSSKQVDIDVWSTGGRCILRVFGMWVAFKE